MTPSATSELTPELIDRVRKLSPADKDRLYLLAIDPPDEQDAANRASLTAELARRCDDVAAGRVPLLDADEVLARLAAKYGEASDE